VRRLLPHLAAVAALTAACGGQTLRAATPTPAPSPTTRPSPPSAEPPVTASLEPPTPTVSPVVLPAGLPTSFDRSLPAGDVPALALVPPGGVVTGSLTVKSGDGVGEQIVVTWTRGNDPFASEQGLAIWQAFPDEPPWRAVYGFADEPVRGVVGIRAELGDLTDDGHADVLSMESTGGSGNCATWRVLATLKGAVQQLYRHKGCDTSIAVSAGSLVLTESVFDAGDAHCCPSAVRVTTLEWDGSSFRVVDQAVTPS